MVEIPGGELKDVEHQNDIIITVEIVKIQLSKTSNWKSPGPDGLQGYWLKNVTAVGRRLVQQLDECLQQKSVPEWIRGKQF